MEALLESSLSYQPILSPKFHLLCPYSQGLVYGRISLLLVCTPDQPPTPELWALCSSTKGAFLSGIQFMEGFLHTPLIICPIEKYDFYFGFLIDSTEQDFHTLLHHINRRSLKTQYLLDKSTLVVWQYKDERQR